MTLGSSSDHDPSLFRILISSDIHLGYGEKHTERGNDSFNTFDELLSIGVKQDVDLVLLGGDLFHENKPSRSAEIKCLQILRNHVLGDRPVQVEYLSDPAKDFAHCNSKCVNYENPNLNIGLPVFSIHGNHDDPSGLGGHSCLDLVHEAGLVNYFGKVTDLKYIKVRPILMRKGDVKVALYGLSNVKDERLHRLFRENKVEFETPAEDASSWCNILVIHQNRAKRGPTNYIPESFLPDFFHLVIWGHEHDCRIVPEASDRDFFICQPGSPTATSLCEGEAISKHVGILNIRADTKFKLDPIPLQTVRPMVFRTISISDLKKVDLTEPDLKRLSNSIETQLKYEVEEMIADAENQLTGHPNQGTRPMLRLRVEYTDETQQLNSARFGNMFMDTVSNASDILLFKKKVAERKVKADNFDMDAMNELDAESHVTIEDLVADYFNNQTDDKNKLAVLTVRNIGGAVKTFIDKDDKDALKHVIDRELEKAYDKLMERGDNLNDEEFVHEEDHDDDQYMRVQETAMKNKNSKNTRGNQRDELYDSDPSEKVIPESSDSDVSLDEPPTKAASRGRGRGRGAVRGTSSTRARGRNAVASPKRVASPAKRGGRGRAPAQSTITAAFARSQASKPASQTQSSVVRPSQRNKKQMFESDSDDDILAAI